MKEITLNSNAKINLSLEVGAVREDGMHPVDTIMQKLTLGDEITVSLKDEGEGIHIEVEGADITTGRDNLAYKAAELMLDTYGDRIPEDIKNKAISIYIKKNIPVAGGLAGGSGNGSIVMKALNELWGLSVSIEELTVLSAKLGSDVPFCTSDDKATRGIGTGAKLTPSTGISCHVVLAKPDIEVSTAKVYKGIDNCEIPERPDNDALESALKSRDYVEASKNMINVLENYTLHAEPEVMDLKNKMIENCKGAFKVLMSGSGPTVFALFEEKEEAARAHEALQALGYRAFLCKTLK